MRSTIGLWFGTLAAAGLSALPAAGFEVVKDGEPRCAIVLSPMASPSERLAAEELAAYVRKISGAALPMRTEVEEARFHHQPMARHDYAFEWVVWKDQPHICSWERAGRPPAPAGTAAAGIVIGTLESLSPIPRAVRTRLEACGDPEAFYIRSEGSHVFVIGKESIGALYGTYTLIENYLGVRWFHPGEEGEVVPRAATVTLPDIDDFQQPGMATRIVSGGGSYNVYDDVIWCARNKLQSRGAPALRWFEAGRCTPERARVLNEALNARGAGGGGHMIWDQTVPDALFETHPEYFPLKDADRKFGGGAGGFQRCLSNPEVFRRVSAHVLAWCGADPDNRFTFDAADSRGTWCDCGGCRKRGTVNGEFKITNLYHDFASRVVRHVLDRNPEARLDIYFYIDKAYPPDDPTIRYEGKHVRGVYCTCWPYARCYAHALTDPTCEPNRKCLANLLAILKICPRLYTYEYFTSSGLLYAPVQGTVARDIRDLAALGVEGFMTDTWGVKGTVVVLERDPDARQEWLARWPSVYLSAKLHWDPGRDPETIMDEAYGLYYGPAAAPMKAYQALRLALWESAPGHAFYGGPRRTAYALTVPDAEAALRARLAEAKRLAQADAAVLARVGQDEQFLDRFWKTGAEKLAKQFSAESQILPEPLRDAVVVDGDLSEKTWLSARPVGGFFKLNTQQPPSQESQFRIAYDDEALYIGFVAMNDKAWGPAVARMTQRDDEAIFRDCHIEIQLAPPGPDGRFYHIGVNTGGRLYDSVMVGQSIDTSYESQAEVAVKTLSDRFVYELRLPLAPMEGDVSPGAVWGVYALRSAHNLQPPEVKETSSLDGNYPHRVLEFRQAVFGGNVVRNGNFADRGEKKKNAAE